MISNCLIISLHLFCKRWTNVGIHLSSRSLSHPSMLIVSVTHALRQNSHAHRHPACVHVFCGIETQSLIVPDLSHTSVRFVKFKSPLMAPQPEDNVSYRFLLPTISSKGIHALACNDIPGHFCRFLSRLVRNIGSPPEI